MISSNLATRSRASFRAFRRHQGFTQGDVMMSTILLAIGKTLAITGDGAYVFDHDRGLLQDPSDSLTMELHPDNRKCKLNLMVNNTGRTILCSKDGSRAVPGFELCPVEASI